MAVPTSALTTRGVKRPAVITGHRSASFVEQHYEVLRELGAGAHGAVWLVKERNSGEDRVCKRVSLEGMEPDKIELMKREIDLLCQLDHPNVVKIYEYAVDAAKNELVLILEQLCGGDAFGLMEDINGPIAESLCAKLIMQTLRGLRYCHLKGIVHRDIKPENLMLSGKPKDAAGQEVCKIIDFGVATHPDSERRGLFGTPAYMAPEVAVFVMEKKNGPRQRTQDYTTQADLWSVGVTALVMLVGFNPFDNGDDDVLKIFKAVLCFTDFTRIHKEVMRSPRTPKLSAEAWDFLRRLLVKDPDARLNAEAALEHRWLQKCITADPLQAFACSQVAFSLRAYEEAPAIVRCCLFLIVARLAVPDLERLGETFLRLDKDGNGRLSREELEEGMKDAAETVDGCNIDVILRAADLDHSGDVDFTEFAAACLYVSYASNGSLDELMEHAFIALDQDRDGFLTLADVLPMFRERDAASFDLLPADRKFDMFEWVDCLRTAAEAGVAKNIPVSVHVTPPQLNSTTDESVAPPHPQSPQQLEQPKPEQKPEQKIEEAKPQGKPDDAPAPAPAPAAAAAAAAEEAPAPAPAAAAPAPAPAASAAAAPAASPAAAEQPKEDLPAVEYSDPEVTHYSYEVLQNEWPADVHPARRQEWLSPEDFEKIFGMSKADFKKIPTWKQQLMKKARGLF